LYFTFREGANVSLKKKQAIPKCRTSADFVKVSYLKFLPILVGSNSKKHGA